MTDKIINGSYKKDTPNEEIGYQKWEVKKNIRSRCLIYNSY